MCWWNSVVQSTKRFNSVVFLRRLKASYSIHLSQHLSWFLFGSWYRICDEQMVLLVSCNFLVIVRRDQFDVSREYVKLTTHILPNVLRRDHWRLEMLDSMGAFPWDDPDQDQWSQITWIMVDQMNQWILVQNGFIGSFDLPRSEWSRITDPDTDHLKGTHPCVLSPLLTVALPLNIRALQWFLPTQKINVDPRQSVNVTIFKRNRGGGGEKLLPIHSLKWNPNDVLTSCKAISKGLVSGFVYWSYALRQIHWSTVLRRNKSMAVEGGTVSHYYILVIRKFIDFMSLFRHSVWFSFSVKQFPSAEFGICNI